MRGKQLPATGPVLAAQQVEALAAALWTTKQETIKSFLYRTLDVGHLLSSLQNNYPRFTDTLDKRMDD